MNRAPASADTSPDDAPKPDSDHRPSGGGAENEQGGERHVPERGQLTQSEAERVEERIKLSATAVYAIIAEEGETELSRSVGSLVWSGLAAGLAMGFSVLTLALMESALPDEPWADLVAGLGYAVGFLLVILGRLQLFTENTITAVLPVISRGRSLGFFHLARLWSIVLIANLVGCALVAYAWTQGGLIPAELGEAVVHASEHLVDMSPSDGFWRGIGAGFLLAALVWSLPSAESSELLLIVIVAWLISVAGFTHVVAGSVEMAALLYEGRIAPDAALMLTLAVLAGNVLGGTGLFALLSYAQVKDDIGGDDESD